MASNTLFFIFLIKLGFVSIDKEIINSNDLKGGSTALIVYI